MPRRFQFSIRSLLLLMLLASLPLGWMAFQQAKRERRWRRFHAIQKLGGQLDLHFCDKGEPCEGDGADDHPPWYIIAVRLPKSRVTDADLALVESIGTLKELDLSETAVTDQGLLRLDHLQKLERLDLHGTRVTEAGISRLQKALPKCEIVW